STPLFRSADLQLARRAVERQVQQAHGALGRGPGLALAGTDHQGTDVQVMPRPVPGQGNVEALALGRHLDFLPPQRAVAGLDHQVAAAGCRRGDRDPGGCAGAVGRLVQGQLDLVRAHRAACGVVLPGVAGPEAQAAGDAGAGVGDLHAVGAPLHREGDPGGAAGSDPDALLAEVEELLVVVVVPALALREAPVVVAALADQAHPQVVAGQLVAGDVGQQDLELGDTVAL